MMTYENIEALLEKYFEGETSLEEEKILRGYFSSPDVDARLMRYASLFQFFTQEKTVELSREATEKAIPKTPLQVVHSVPKTTWNWGRALRYAAAIAILVVGTGVLFKTFWQPIEPTNQTAHRKAKIIEFDEKGDPEKALAEIEKALMKTSKKLKKGTDEAVKGLEKVSKASEVFEK